MDNITAFFYSIINQIDLIVSYPYALFHTTLFGPVYAIQLIIWVFKGLFRDDKDGKGKRGRGGKGGNNS